jgi:hypothetical protein
MTLPIKETEDEEFIKSIADIIDFDNYTYFGIKGEDNTSARYVLFTVIGILVTGPLLIMFYNTLFA